MLLGVSLARAGAGVELCERRADVDRVAGLDQDALSRPDAGEGISTSILSVVTRQMVSSRSTQSPGRLRHSTIVPSATETPIWGITTRPAVSVGEELTAGLLHVVELGQDRLLERRAERDRHVGRRQRGGPGASRDSNACSEIRLATSAPTPQERVASCATRTLPVF